MTPDEEIVSENDIQQIDRLDKLRNIPAFCDFARKHWEECPEYWTREAESGTGIMQAVAVAVCIIGKEPSARREALKEVYGRIIAQLQGDPFERLIFIQCFAALDAGEGHCLAGLYMDEFNKTLIQYQEAKRS